MDRDEEWDALMGMPLFQEQRDLYHPLMIDANHGEEWLLKS